MSYTALPQPLTLATWGEPGAQRPAALHTAGGAITFAELDAQSRRLAGLLAARGLERGDHLAVLIDNRLDFFVAAWAAQRFGLHYTPVNWHLTAGEATYIVSNSEARALVASPALAPLAATVASALPGLECRLVLGGAAEGFEQVDPRRLPEPVDLAECEGAVMFYSSGTTGRPKGIKRTEAIGAPWGTAKALESLMAAVYGFGPGTVYLSPGSPLYHAAPLAFSMGAQRLGGTVVVMPSFDAEGCLRMIEANQVTHAQFVPTMLVRMLKLPEQTRRRYDLSSLEVVIHAAAPCPAEVKRAMIDWLGPIVWEYYSSSEGAGFCTIDSPTWLAHPGSVGRAVSGEPHVLGPDGDELPAGETGTLWFSGVGAFEYHGDPAKTSMARNRNGWVTIGDLGYVDRDRYVYLVERRSDLVISGGVNIYPREVEDVLVVHPGVTDVAVIGVPDEELGMRLKAVVEPASGVEAGPMLAASLDAHCRERLAGFKCPRSYDFVEKLPRLPSGKVRKAELAAAYR